MVQNKERRFTYPTEGVLPGENILWRCRGTANFFALVCAFSTPTFFIAFVEIFEMELNDVIFLLLLGATVVIPILILSVYFFMIHPTWYYLTTERVIKVEKRTITKEIPLAHIAGRPTSEVIDVTNANMDPDHPLYFVRFYDPTSGETIKFPRVNPYMLDTIKELREVVECPQCGHKNTTLSNRCYYCGVSI